MTATFSSPAYKRSRIAYAFECAFEYFVTIIVADSFLSQLLKNIGMSDADIGMISSLISLAFLFQLCAVPVLRNIVHRKRFAILVHTAGQLLFMAIYLVPFIPVDGASRRFLAVFLIMAAYFGNYFVTSYLYSWGNSFVEPVRLGRFCARKEMLSLVTGCVVQLFSGIAVDYYVGLDNLNGSFLFCAVSIMSYALMDLICLLLMQEESHLQIGRKEHVPLKEILRNTVGVKPFRKTIWLGCLFRAGTYAVVGFVSTYKLGELGMSMTLVQIINLVSCLLRFAFSIPFGVYTDRTSFVRANELGLLVMGASTVALIFTVPETWWLMIVYTALFTISQAGTSANYLNMTYRFITPNWYPEATAIRNAISGAVGFLVSVVCGQLLSHIQNSGNVFLGIPVYGQQVLAVIATLLTAAAWLYSRFVISKEKPLTELDRQQPDNK